MPPREPAEFLGLVAAAGVLLLAIFLALAVWSLSPAERIGTLRQDVSPATVVKRIDPTLEDTGSTLRDRVSEVVRPAVELPGKIASPMDLVPDWPVDRPVAILLLGTDKRPGDPFAKTDTMLVVRIDPVSNSAVVIGVPRDICVDLCDTEPYRINSVLFYEGPNALRDRVGDLLGVTIDHHVIMNFAGFIKLIDFVGGVRGYLELEKRCQKDCAVAFALPPGVFITIIFFSFATGTSILSTPAPALPITFKFFAAEIIFFVTFVADLTTIPS